MAIVLDATVGGVNSNTYSTLVQAETYMESRLHKATWSAASDEDKNIALLWATRELDQRISWAGYIVVDTQALSWPRDGVLDPNYVDVTSTAIPQFLVDATAEYAMRLISDDRLDDDDTKGFKSIHVSSIQLVIDKYDRIAAIPPSVWSMLSFYGQLQTGIPRSTIRM